MKQSQQTRKKIRQKITSLSDGEHVTLNQRWMIVGDPLVECTVLVGTARIAERKSPCKKIPKSTMKWCRESSLTSRVQCPHLWHMNIWQPLDCKATTRSWANVDLKLAQRRRRWANFGSTLAQDLVFAGHDFNLGAAPASAIPLRMPGHASKGSTTCITGAWISRGKYCSGLIFSCATKYRCHLPQKKNVEM